MVKFNFVAKTEQKRATEIRPNTLCGLLRCAISLGRDGSAPINHAVLHVLVLVDVTGEMIRRAALNGDRESQIKSNLNFVSLKRHRFPFKKRKFATGYKHTYVLNKI